MKAPINWLNDFTPVKGIEIKTIADSMTLSGSKVEGVETTGQEITRVVTGRILEITKHPDADKLVVCRIDVGDRELQIVTGAKNVSAGDIVPVALDGSTLADNLKIKTGKLRGVVSEGMLCSIEELGYTSADFPDACEDGIYILPSDTPIQQDILSVLGLGDSIIDFEITSNRPDCLSIEGLARETAITLDLPFTPVDPKVKGMPGFYTRDLIRIDIREPLLCKRYIARSVRNIRIAPSPQWMVSRLRDAGVRSINNIVDITNYVMLELGQPMHAFDYEDLHDRTIWIRRASKGEKMTTLDKTVHTLDESVLVIADAHKPVALAGIMGGENSEIKETTKTIIFESATFDGINVRLTAKKLGLRTESSSRFEKGLDTNNAKRAIDRACELIEILECGEVSEDEIDLYPKVKEISRIAFRPDWINRFLGTEIPEETMIGILQKLECRLVTENGKRFWEIPGFRPDLEQEVDLSEEVARFYGYNRIPPTLLSGKSTTLGGLNAYQKQKETISAVMRSCGFYEACTYSFTSPSIFDKLCVPVNDPLRDAVTIINPLGEDYSVMRTTMLGSLLEIASTNWNRGVDTFKIFEIAKVYIKKDHEVNELPYERDTLGVVYFSEDDKYETAESFFAVKGIAEELMKTIGVPSPAFQSCTDHPSFHPGRTSKILDGDREIGIMGFIHPDVAQRMNAPVETIVLMMDLEAALTNASSKKSFSQLPKFPSMTRDLALVIDRAIPIATVDACIVKFGGQYLESVKLFDIYTGKQIDESKKSVAYKLVFRSQEGTLTDEIVNKAQTRLLNKLSSELNATLR